MPEVAVLGLSLGPSPRMDRGEATEALGDTPARDVDDTTSIMEFGNVGDSLPPQRRKRRASAGRRVSFADITKVHVFKRDDEYETPPEAQTEDTTTTGGTTADAGRRRSPRLADKLTRKDSLDEARVALAPRFDVATRSVAAGVSPSGTNELWVLQRETPDSDSGETESDEFGPVDFRRLRDDNVDDDDVTGDTPLFTDLLKADGTATCPVTLLSGQPEFARGEGNASTYPLNELEMSLTDIPSKWPIQRPNFALEDSPDSDMSFSSEFPIKEMLQATPAEESIRHKDLVEVPIVSSPEYDEGFQASDMELVTTSSIAYEQGQKAGKRKADDTYATKRGRRSSVKSQKLVLSSSQSAVKFDKENLPPENLVPKRSGNKKRGITKARIALSLKNKPDNLNVQELLEPGNKDVTLDRAEVTMAIPRLSDLLKADEADSEGSSPVELSGVHQTVPDLPLAGEAATPTGSTITSSHAERENKSAVAAYPSREVEGSITRARVMKIARLLQIVKEKNIGREQRWSGAAEIAVMQLTAKPKSLAESLRFSLLSKPQMQLREARLQQLKMALTDLKSEISEMSLPNFVTSSLNMEYTSCQEFDSDVLNVENTARNFLTKHFQGYDKVLQTIHENKMAVEKELEIWRSARESQKVVQELAADLKSAIASTAIKVKDKACRVSRVADLDAKLISVILQQIQHEEKTLNSRNSLLVQLRCTRKKTHDRLEQAKSELKPQTSEEATLREEVHSLTKKLEFSHEAMRLQVKTCIIGRQVLEVTYFDLISQRFFRGHNEQLVMCSNLVYRPDEIDKVFPSLNASNLFLGFIPPFEDKVLGAAKDIPGCVQKTQWRVWKLLLLMEEVQECKYRFLVYLTAPHIIGSKAKGFEVSLKFTELKKVVRFGVRLNIDAESLSLNGKCNVDVDYVGKAAQSCLSAETIIKTVTAVQPGYWRITRICEAVQRLLDNVRKSS